MDKMFEVVELLRGTHDFASLTGGQSQSSRDQAKTTIKTIEDFNFSPANDTYSSFNPLAKNVTMWQFCVKSKAFLYKQVCKKSTIS